MTERPKPEIQENETEAKVDTEKRGKIKHVVIALASPHPEEPDKRKYEVIDRTAAEEILAPWINSKTGTSQASERSGSLNYDAYAKGVFISDLMNQDTLKKSQSTRLNSIITAIRTIYADRTFDTNEDYIDLVNQPIEGLPEKVVDNPDAWKSAQDDTKPPPPPVPGAAANAEYDMDAFLSNLRSTDESEGLPFGGPPPPTPSRVSQAPLQDIYTVVDRSYRK